MANDARRRMVRTMSRLLQRQGFHATGLNQVVTESEAPKGSIYHHFPGGKEQLTIEAITTSGAAMEKGMASALASGQSAASAIRSLVDGTAAALERSGFEQGCPIATVALEIASDSEPIRQACAAVFDTWERLIAGRLVADGAEPASAAATASLVLAALEGGLLLARTRQDTAPLRAVADAVERLVA